MKKVEFELPKKNEFGWYVPTKYRPFYYLRESGEVLPYSDIDSVYFKTEKEADMARLKYMGEWKMKKEDLRTGMLVEISNDGGLRIVLGNALMGVAGTNGGIAMKFVDDNLTMNRVNGGHITAVYEELHKDCSNYVGAGIEWFARTSSDDILLMAKCIWRRPKPVEMTLEQVCDLLGKNIKIVKG